MVTWRAVGCTACKGSGYNGRIGVFEAIRIDDVLRAMINDGTDEAHIAARAFAATPTLSASVRALVIAGETTAEEAIRIARHDEPESEVSDDGV